jgi:predicted  nucleic acid-binding Zn-ribbon protein
MASHRPEDIARYTVERNDGQYATDVPDLLSLFGRQQLNDAARQEVRTALRDVGVGTDPDLLVAQQFDQIRLFLLQEEEIPAASAGWSSGPGLLARLRPRTWKGWLGYSVALVLVIVALSDSSEDSTRPTPVSETVEKQTSSDQTREALEERQAARRARVEARKRARIRRARAAARERARVRRVRAARRREQRAARIAAQREEQERLEAEALAQEQEQEAATSCHPSYDPCLDPNAGDYDCSGGEGDGPKYTGTVSVTGPDDYDLDRDGDGIGCD